MNLRHDHPILDLEAMNCLVFKHGSHLAFWAYYIWLSQLRSFRFLFFCVSFCLGLLFKSLFALLLIDRGVGGL